MQTLHWTDRSTVKGDVVFFQYAEAEIEKKITDFFVWDLDKTYLDSKIESLSGLFRTVMERALQKKNVPGTTALLLALSEFRKEVMNESEFPIYFITASPPQLEERISEKFLIDGIRPLGCFYKDNIKNLTPSRFWRLRAQVGYKLQALLQLRSRWVGNVSQICFGDDSETDAVIYNLYSDICSRRISNPEIRSALERYSVTSEQIDEIFKMQDLIPVMDPLQRIYINLAIDTDADYYLKFGRRTLATYNSFQVAIDLFQHQKLHLVGVYRVAQDLIMNYNFSSENLMRNFEDLIRRGSLNAETFEVLKNFFIEKGMLTSDYEPSVRPRKESDIQHEPWVPEHIDYFHDYR
ncbi:MAG TPA: hypothetical protein PLJ21_13490 [Pseudobdellovibrionaceae bacterium]|nr:hypothetical protein [Pseudobdellovibrionaceae bacterium]